MRPKLIVAFAMAVLVAGLAVPAGLHTSAPQPTDCTVAVHPGSAVGAPARLHVEYGPGTVVDRGSLAGGGTGEVLCGSFRYWEEPAGRALYVWDDTQTLLARVLNPDSVTLLP